MAITVTEALAEIKTIDKRVQKKREFIVAYLLRPDALKDPLQSDGGSVSAILRERQSIADLLERKISIRRAIQVANSVHTITIGEDTRTLADWLVWRRDVAPIQQQMLNELRMKIEGARQESQRRGNQLYNAAAITDSVKPTDIIVNLSEQNLARQAEALEEALSTLDGQLSLKNATMTLDV